MARKASRQSRFMARITTHIKLHSNVSNTRKREKYRNDSPKFMHRRNNLILSRTIYLFQSLLAAKRDTPVLHPKRFDSRNIRLFSSRDEKLVWEALTAAAISHPSHVREFLADVHPPRGGSGGGGAITRERRGVLKYLNVIAG